MPDASLHPQDDLEVVVKRGPGRPPKRVKDAPKNLKEFKREVHENLRTLDGAHAVAVDERNVKCVCGKVVRLCNVFYWRYATVSQRSTEQIFFIFGRNEYSVTKNTKYSATKTE